MTTALQIRNSTAEFLIFQLEDNVNGIEVFYKASPCGLRRKPLQHSFMWKDLLSQNT